LLNPAVHEDEYNYEESLTSTIEIPMTGVTTTILKRIVEFCEDRIAEPMSTIEVPLKSYLMSDVVQNYYVEFANVEEGTLRVLIMAAYLMKINALVD
jgi:hypothetical protein